MFYSQVILAKKGPLAKVWLAAHWGDKKLARPQIFATDIAQSVDTIVNPTMPLALRMSGHLLLGVVRIYSRKVKYVLNDCTEAMLKLQMAFTNQQQKGKELLDSTGGAAGNVGNSSAPVANFGEYDQVHVVEGFCLPLPDNSEWIVADDEDEDGAAPAALQALPQVATQSPEARYQPPTEETWTAFDPDNEDEDDDMVPGSRVSDVEVARAAGDSFLSGDETRRGSSIMDKSPAMMAAPRGLEQEEEEPDFAHIPFDDDEEEDDAQQQQMTPGGNKDDSLLHLSHSGADVSALDTPMLLDESQDTASTKRPGSELPRKRRKRRKVIIDNDSTELNNEQIRSMLADTSDIVKRMPHPADPEEASDEHKGPAASSHEDLFVLTRPFLADKGRLHPDLVTLWEDNFYRALDRPCPFERMEETEEMELTRRQQQQDEDDDASKASDMDDQGPVPQMEEEEEPDDFAPPPMDDDEEEEVAAPPLDDSSDEEEDLVAAHAGGIGDFGLVNELQIESEDEEDREAVGEHTGTKWHKHTVKVLKLLQSRIRVDGEEEDDDGEEKPAALEFGDLAKNVNRRTAASCFIECLQLKTWDFVELAQDESYGPITISAGPRFQEAPPNDA